jgi:hypothetical protein
VGFLFARDPPFDSAQGRLWDTPVRAGKARVLLFQQNLVKTLEARFFDQLADSMGEIKLDNMSQLPYAL